MSDYSLREHTLNLTLETLPLALLTLKKGVSKRLGRVNIHQTEPSNLDRPLVYFNQRMARAITCLALEWDDRRENQEEWTPKKIQIQAMEDMKSLAGVMATWPTDPNLKPELGALIVEETMTNLIGGEIHAPLQDAWTGVKNARNQRILRTQLIWEQERPNLVAYLNALGFLKKERTLSGQWPSLGYLPGAQGLIPQLGKRWCDNITQNLPQQNVPVLITALQNARWVAADVAWNNYGITPDLATLALHALLGGACTATQSTGRDKHFQKMGEWTERLLHAGANPDHEFLYTACGLNDPRPPLTIYGPFNGAILPPNDKGTLKLLEQGWQETEEYERGPLRVLPKTSTTAITTSSLALELTPHMVLHTLSSFPRKYTGGTVAEFENRGTVFEENIRKTKVAGQEWIQAWTKQWSKTAPVLSFPGQRRDGALDVLVGKWIQSVQSLANDEGGITQEMITKSIGSLMGYEWMKVLSIHDGGEWLTREPNSEHPWDTVGILAAASCWNQKSKKDPMAHGAQIIFESLIEHIAQPVTNSILVRVARTIIPTYPLTLESRGPERIQKQTDTFRGTNPMDILNVIAQKLDPAKRDAVKEYLERIEAVREEEAQKIVQAYIANPNFNTLKQNSKNAAERLMLMTAGGMDETNSQKKPRIL